MPRDEFAHLLYRVNAVEVALALRRAPRKQAVTTEKDAVGPGIFSNSPLDEQGQFKARALPGDPNHLAAKFLVEFFQLALAIGARSQGDGPIRVEVVQVRKGEKGMKRSVN
jgi:hypothetical protein